MSDNTDCNCEQALRLLDKLQEEMRERRRQRDRAVLAERELGPLTAELQAAREEIAGHEPIHAAQSRNITSLITERDALSAEVDWLREAIKGAIATLDVFCREPYAPNSALKAERDELYAALAASTTAERGGQR